MEERKIDVIGKKLSSWIAEITDLFTGDVDVITANDDNHVYEITRKENAQVLYVRDITEYAVLKKRFESDGVVAGLLQLDNYMEIQQYVDEGKMAQINLQLRQPCVEWANKYGMFIHILLDFHIVIDVYKRQALLPYVSE